MQVAVITGASSGIGAALVDVARSKGAHVATTSRRPADGDAHVSLDLADPSSWADLRGWLTELITDDVTHLTVVHAAATIRPIGFAGEVDAAEMAHAAMLNSVVPQIVGDAAIAAAGNRRTTVALLTSGAARSVYAGLATYCAGKAALDQWVRVAGAEQDQRGSDVLVWAVAPGVVESDMQVQMRATDMHDFPNSVRHRDLEEQGDLDTPQDVAVRLWSLTQARAHPNGAILDLRDL